MYPRYHPDKNANDPKATDMFNEITFSYNILSDPDKRHQYDTAGFEVKFSSTIYMLWKISKIYLYIGFMDTGT